VIGALVKAGIAQPDDLLVAVATFNLVMVVRRERVRLEVPMCNGVVMIGVAFVHVLRWNGGIPDKPRCERQHEKGAAEPEEHAPIMGGYAPDGQPIWRAKGWR
jgi:hypothetical protein